MQLQHAAVPADPRKVHRMKDGSDLLVLKTLHFRVPGFVAIVTPSAAIVTSLIIAGVTSSIVVSSYIAVLFSPGRAVLLQMRGG